MPLTFETSPKTKPASKPKRPRVDKHPVFAEVCELVESRENVMLVGPAGTGKSYLAKQVADSFSLSFGSISCSGGISESHFFGRILPLGKRGQFKFASTPFLDCYENGGIFLLDEMDAADENVLVSLNGAIANKRVEIPARHKQPLATMHADFCLIAACNTFGRGADRQYVGRGQLDESTLDRFRIGTIEVDYSRELELTLWTNILGENNDSDLGYLWGIRDAVINAKLERCVSTRFIISAAKAISRGRDIEYVTNKLTAGWRSDELAKIGGAK